VVSRRAIMAGKQAFRHEEHLVGATLSEREQHRGVHESIYTASALSHLSDVFHGVAVFPFHLPLPLFNITLISHRFTLQVVSPLCRFVASSAITFMSPF
jgi:hypothetical protein